MQHSVRALSIAAACLVAAAASTVSARAQDSSPPVISEITSLVTPPSEYSTIVISGENLKSSDGLCPVEVSGLLAYPANCTPTTVAVVIPWNATSGDVIVYTDGVPSNAVPIEIGPLPEDFEASVVAGRIIVRLAPGEDIGPVLESQGEPADAAEPLFDSDDPLLADWYTVTVPEGEEIAKCRAYAMHPDVLEVGPGVFVGDPTPTPGAWPSSGAESSSGAAGGGLLRTGLGALAILGSGLVGRQLVRTRSRSDADNG